MITWIIVASSLIVFFIVAFFVGVVLHKESVKEAKFKRERYEREKALHEFFSNIRDEVG